MGDSLARASSLEVTQTAKRCDVIAARRFVDNKALAYTFRIPLHRAWHCSEKSAQGTGPNALERTKFIATDQLSTADKYHVRLIMLAMSRGRVMMPYMSQALGNCRPWRSPKILASIPMTLEYSKSDSMPWLH